MGVGGCGLQRAVLQYLASSRMHKQLSLAGFEAVPQPTDRLFFALYPDVGAAARTERLAQHLRAKHRLQGDPLAVEHFHVTLHFLGEYVGRPQHIVTAASDAAAAVVMPPFQIAFDRALSFSRPHNLPFVLCGSDGVGALMAFHQALGKAVKKAGLGRLVKRGYTPHMTLLYDDRCVPEQPVETIAWIAHEFVLADSLIGQNRHVPLARWQLRG